MEREAGSQTKRRERRYQSHSSSLSGRMKECCRCPGAFRDGTGSRGGLSGERRRWLGWRRSVGGGEGEVDGGEAGLGAR